MSIESPGDDSSNIERSFPSDEELRLLKEGKSIGSWGEAFVGLIWTNGGMWKVHIVRLYEIAPPHDLIGDFYIMRNDSQPWLSEPELLTAALTAQTLGRPIVYALSEENPKFLLSIATFSSPW